MADFKHLVRVANTDLQGGKPVSHALTGIKGVGPRLALVTCKKLKIDPKIKIGELPEPDVKKINEFLKNPDLPKWFLNRPVDRETGESKHLLVADLDFQNENDVKRLKMIKAYRGIRHMFHLPSRGQRTKSNFRRNKGKVTGVKRKK